MTLPFSPVKILTIDDELLVRNSFRFFLEDLDYQILEAESGREGLELAERENPDLILLDLRMPDMDGLQTLNRIKEQQPEIPVIVISGTGDLRDVVEALRSGAADYLTKPVTNLTVLEHAIRKSLERSRLLKENLLYQESLELQVENRTAELVEAYQELNTSKQTLEALFQSAPLAIILFDREKRVTLWNRGAEQLFGWTAAEVEGEACPLFKDLKPQELAIFWGQKLNSHEQSFLNRQQEKLILRISTAEIDINQLNSGNMVMLFENITEKKRLQTEADRANRLASLGQLAAGVAHEINNPNGLVLLNIPTLSDILTDALDLLKDHPPEVRLGGLTLARARNVVPQLAEETEDAARRIRQIVEDLKDFASRDARNDSVTFDLNQSAEKALRLAGNRIKQATDLFSFELTESLPLVHGNPQRIEQVIVNLVVNACEALNSRSAQLKLQTRIDIKTGHAILQVVDQGSGISAADMPHITDPFFTTRRETGGTGLGLSVSSRIVREHAGRLQFESELGKGTCATLMLPLIQERP